MFYVYLNNNLVFHCSNVYDLVENLKSLGVGGFDFMRGLFQLGKYGEFVFYVDDSDDDVPEWLCNEIHVFYADHSL